MTRDEIYANMYDEEEIYRPPLENGSALLEVTHGCSYAGCLFCDFRRDQYSTIPLEHIRNKIELLSMVINGNERLYLLGCNPLCMSMDFLISVLDMIHHRLPSVKSVSMYARADDINKKGRDNMMRLREAGVTDLHVGLESGSDIILKMHNKGETVSEIENALNLLTSCGIMYHLTAIPGLGGKELSDEHAISTARLLSRLEPLSIWCLALKVWPDTPLYHMVENGSFHPMSPLEILKEERKMVDLLKIDFPCLYVDSTVLNKYTIMANIPESKEYILEQMDQLISAEEQHNISLSKK